MTNALAVLSQFDLLVLYMDDHTERDLRVNPPLDDETMAQIGIPSKTLDTYIRYWINNRIREPLGKSYLKTGTIKSDTTWVKLKEAINA